MSHTNYMDGTMLLRASAIGAAAMAYVALLIFHYDIFSMYTLFFAILGAGAGILIAYRVRFR